MSLLPFFVDATYPTSHHTFGLGHPGSSNWISPVERSLLHSLGNTGHYLRSRLGDVCELENKAKIGKDGFQVCLDVQHFLPNEITVKTENDSIFVNGRHEEKEDEHGYITREFTRRYELPKGFKVEDVTSSLSSDGILSIKCPTASAIEGSNVRHVQIQQTGPARKSIKSNEDKKEKD